MEILVSIFVVVLSLAIGGVIGSWGFNKAATKIAAADFRANQPVSMGVGPNARAVYVPTSDLPPERPRERAEEAA